MKMSRKLMILFSLLAVLMTAANSFYFYQSSMAGLEERTYEHLRTLGGKMLNELEQYVQLMDYALESLTANVDFMNALYIACLQEDTADIGVQVAVQTSMSRTLYQEPILENFYRVSVYARNGFFLSNRFQKTDSVISLSDEARETVATLPYLEQVDVTPFQRHLISSHRDAWTTTQDVSVFSAVRTATWHGKHIGYLEVDAPIDDLANIFFLKEMEEVKAQVIFDNGEIFFKNHGDDVCYPDLNPGSMTHIRIADGSERLVIQLHSNHLGLSIFVSQDMSIYNQQAKDLLLRYGAVACFIFLIALLFITVFSLSLTRAIRMLTKKVHHMPVDNLMKHPEEALTTTVTHHQDQEIYHLEQVFNDLIDRLRISMQNEITMRESTLQSQLHALQMQINPHFMYNTLNMISAKSMESGNEDVIQICDQFAQMLRYASDLRTKTATLGEELQNTRRYLLLSKARYEDQLNFIIDVPEQIESILIPKLTLQPIVENSLTHGFIGRMDQREIKLTAHWKNGILRLMIRDNGNGFDQKVLHRLRSSFRQIEQKILPQSEATDGHIGLINTYLRLHYYSHGKMHMTLYNDCGAVVALTLPCQKEEKHVSSIAGR